MPCQRKQRYAPLFIYCVIVTNLSGFINGYNVGIVAQIEHVMKKWLQKETKRDYQTPTTIEAQNKYVTLIWAICVSVMAVGGIVGGILVDLLCKFVHRRRTLMLADGITIIAAIMMGSSEYLHFYYVFIAGRFLVGIALGFHAGVAPTLILELCPIRVRGIVGSTYQLSVTIGICTAQMMGFPKLLGNSNRWPGIFYILIIPAVLQMLGLLLVPSSPFTILQRIGNFEKAKKTLIRVRRSSDKIDEEMAAIVAEYNEAKSNVKITWKTMLTETKYTIALKIVIILMFAQQLSGINAVLFYAKSIFDDTGLTNEFLSSFAIILMGYVNIITTIVSISVIEKVGRKTLLVGGFGGCAICNIFLMFCILYEDFHQSIKYTTIIVIQIFLISFAIGPGSIPWFIVSELFNKSAKDKASTIAVVANLSMDFTVSVLFPIIKESIQAYVFLIFVMITFALLLFIMYLLPETKNKPADEIIKELLQYQINSQEHISGPQGLTI